MPGGNVGAGVVVDLTRGFDRMDPVDPDARTVRVGPGVRAGAVDRAARRAGLFLPPLPSSADRCCVGGMVANNAAGARSFRYGATRDWVRSLTVVTADGEILHLEAGDEPPVAFRDLHRALRPRWSALSDAWPGVRKNASGYALDRFLPSGDPVQLLIGSEGTLGLVTEVKLALAPLPRARAVAVVAMPTPDAFLRGVRAAGELGASACEFLGRRFLELARTGEHPDLGELARDAYALLLYEVEGSPTEVERDLDRLQELAEGAGGSLRAARTPDERERLWEIRHAASPTIARAAAEGRVSMQFVEDSVVPPERLPDYLRRLDRILVDAETDAVVFGHAGDGNVHVNPLVDVERSGWRDRVRTILEETAALVSDLGGTLSGEHGDGRVRAPFLERVWGSTAADAFRRVKETLDPDGILNPGVVIPLVGQDPLEGMTGETGTGSPPRDP